MANIKSEREIQSLAKWAREQLTCSQQEYVAIFNVLEQIDSNLFVSDVYKFFKLLDEQGFKVIAK
jgi:hypothetical protein